MARRILSGILVLALLVAVAAVATAPAGLVNDARMPEMGAELDDWLAEEERAVSATSAIIPDTEKRIRWFDGQRNSKTRYSIVYLHGFSATRQEIAPVGALIADALGANLFETRLTGHGLSNDPLAHMRAEDWLDDAAEALAVGAAIGDEVVVMGTSTGATLALAMIGHESFDNVSAIVLLSPNFAPRDASAEFLTWPGGPQLAYMVVGDMRSWTPWNELQGRFWSTSYPMDAVIEMMRLVKYVRGKLPMKIDQSLLTIYSPADQVVDIEWIRSALEQIDSPRSRIIEMPGSGDPSNHVLAGDILSPDNNEPVSRHVAGFILDNDL